MLRRCSRLLSWHQRFTIRIHLRSGVLLQRRLHVAIGVEREGHLGVAERFHNLARIDAFDAGTEIVRRLRADFGSTSWTVALTSRSAARAFTGCSTSGGMTFGSGFSAS